MAMERNGVVFFDPTAKNDDHPAFKALKAVSLGDVRFPFGFFLIERNGERYVLPGTKDDLLKALLTAFPDYPTQSFSGGCGSIWDICPAGIPAALQVLVVDNAKHSIMNDHRSLPTLSKPWYRGQRLYDG
jgi:hypothetical protein